MTNFFELSNKTLKKIKVKIFKIQYPTIANVMEKVQEKKLSYLESRALWELVQAVRTIESKQLPGIMIETGCAAGGSAIVMSSVKSKERDFFVYDVFGMIPPPSDRDGEDVQQRYEVIKSGEAQGIDGNTYYGYEENLYEKVIQSFIYFGLPVKENNVHLVKGLYEDALKINNPVAFAHIDCDWYDSVMVCLNQIEPQLISGGILVIDDYYAWSGCKKAVDDYFESKDKSQYKFLQKSRLNIIKR